MSNTIVVTRHAGLVEYLRQEGIIGEDTPVIEHATQDSVWGKHVIGVLPLHLAVYALSVTEVPMDIPAELRGQELTAEQTRQYARRPSTYEVQTYLNLRQIEESKADEFGKWWVHYQVGSPGSGEDVGISIRDRLAVALAVAKEASLNEDGIFAVAPARDENYVGLPVAGYWRGKLGTYGFVPTLELPTDEEV